MPSIADRQPTLGQQLIAGWAGAFVGQGILGVLFTRAPVRDVLFDPELQSPLFIELASTRNIPLSVAGLVLFGGIYGWLQTLLAARYPTDSVGRSGLRLGALIWGVYWLPQEWFIYHTLLHEPLLLCALELVLLALGSLVAGCVTVAAARVLQRRTLA